MENIVGEVVYLNHFMLSSLLVLGV